MVENEGKKEIVKKKKATTIDASQSRKDPHNCGARLSTGSPLPA